MLATYSLTPTYRVLRDSGEDARRKELALHLESGDYFPFLATVIGFLSEAVRECPTTTDSAVRSVEAARKIQDDLLYLQERYRIVRSDTPSSYTRKKSIRFP